MKIEFEITRENSGEIKYQASLDGNHWFDVEEKELRKTLKILGRPQKIKIN